MDKCEEDPERDTDKTCVFEDDATDAVVDAVLVVRRLDDLKFRILAWVSGDPRCSIIGLHLAFIGYVLNKSSRILNYFLNTLQNYTKYYG